MAVFGLLLAGARALGVQASVVGAHELSCPIARAIFPNQGLDPMSSALAGGFSATGPPGKSPNSVA